jgi:PBP1b-binding outer membrane lipoprotein LpoB
MITDKGANAMKILTRISILTAILAFSLFLAGCQEEGPVEKAGEKIDEAVENVEEKINPQGPAEEAGEKIDEAVEKTKEEASDAKKKIEESVK